MFLSIVIPVWNDEKYLNECLDSCLNQELSRDEYEIICVDDGSTDRTPEILRDYAERYPNIRIITKQHGPEFGNGRTIGMKAANADFVWFVDHDDFIAPGTTDELRRIVGQNPDYDRYAFPYYRFNAVLTEEERELIRTGELKSKSGTSDKTIYVWSSIFRLSFLRENQIFPRSLQIAEAGEFWGINPFWIFGGDTAMMNECKEKGVRTFQLTGRPFYFYRIHAGQTISSADPEQAAKRAEQRRNRVLYLGHRAWVQKDRYLRLRETDPAAAKEALADSISRICALVSYATHFLEDWAWKDVLRRFREKDVLYRRKPRDYPESLRTHLKKFPKRDLFNPKKLVAAVVNYYAFTYWGAGWFYRLNYKRRKKEADRVKKLAAK